MKLNRSIPTQLILLAVAIIATLIATPQGSAHDSSAAPYHLLKKIVLGGEGGCDYFTVDPATHHLFIVRGDYVMVLDSDGNVVGKLDVGKTNEAHAVALAPDL